MSLRVDIQKRLIDLFKKGDFPVVKYDSSGIPSVADEKLIPAVLCNELSTGLVQKADSQGLGYVFNNWAFAVYCEFKKEVDLTGFILDDLKDITFNSSGYLITASVGGSVVIKHPPRQGAETGTVAQFNFNIKIRR